MMLSQLKQLLSIGSLGLSISRRAISALNGRTGRSMYNLLKLGILITIAFLSVFTMMQRSSRAWNGTLPQCVYAGALDWEWKRAIADINPQHDPDTTDFPYFIVSYDNDPVSTSNTLSVQFQTQISLDYTNPLGNHLRYTGPGTAYNISKNPASPSYQTSIQVQANPSSATQTTSPACITTVYNALRTNAYIANGGIEYSSVPPAEDLSCDTLDIACRLQMAFQGIQNTFLSVGQTITSTIASFFLPDPNFLVTKINEFYAFLQTELGFLMFAPDLAYDVVQTFQDNPDNWCTNTSCTFSAPGTFFGGTYSVDLLTIKNGLPSMWTLFTTLTRGLLVAEMIFFLHRKLVEILRHDS